MSEAVLWRKNLELEVTTWISGDGQKSRGACGTWGLNQYLGYVSNELFILKRKKYL